MGDAAGGLGVAGARIDFILVRPVGGDEAEPRPQQIVHDRARERGGSLGIERRIDHVRGHHRVGLEMRAERRQLAALEPLAVRVA